ncbi:Rne/Rng family ribonuclease [Hyphococcus sp.]|uniref:Rne/Rng family ribonuclease n=1 Tax=Hyphococcus sp. TaxID=2038636 RepID=UPI0035C6C276
MTKKMLIDAAHPEEVRVAVLDNGKVEDFDFESEARKPLRGNIYLARVTRVEPSLQAAFVEYGGNRHGFLAFSEIHPDYYQIPVSDRQALQAAEAEVAELASQLELSSRGDEDHDDDEDDEDTEENASHNKRRRSRKADDNRDDEEDAAEEKLKADGDDDDSDDDADPTDEIIGDPSEEEEEEEDGEEDEGNGAPAPVRTEDEDEDAKASDEDTVDAAAEDADSEEEPAVDDNAEDDNAEDDDADAVEASAEDSDADDEQDDDSEDEDEDDAEDEEAETPETKRSKAKERDALFERYKDAKRRRSQLLRNYKIQEVIKRRQILLVQVVKEERGNKGAALTTYMSLAGRYCVLMPNTARGGGISRKIPHSTDRKRLRRVVDSLDVPQGMGLIIRTAGAKRTKTEIKRDYDYLLRLWENIRSLTLKSVAPCLIYEEASLIKRAIRDLYDKDIGEVQVEGEAGYREAKDFMKMLMPSHAKHVQPYKGAAPIFLKHGVEQQLDGMYHPTVRLKSGGYIVIHQTEALVAIDVNSGRATRERNIEQTALKTNIEAAYEAARQFRMRDLAGLIVLDFIDMEEQRNNRKVEKALKDAIKHDRARIQLGRISNFGLLEMSRQRRRSGIVDGTTQACPTCAGAGVIRSAEMAAIRILRAVEGEAATGRAGVLSVHASLDVTVYILNHHRDWLKRIEDANGVTVQLIPDTDRTGDDYTLEKSGAPRERTDMAQVIQADQTDLVEAPEEPEAEAASDDTDSEERDGERKKRRRRRRRKDRDTTEARDSDASSSEEDGDGEKAEEREAHDGDGDTSEDGEKRRRRRRGRRGGRRNRRNRDDATDGQDTDAAAQADDNADGDAVKAEAEASSEPAAAEAEPAREQPVAAEEAEPAPQAETKKPNGAAHENGHDASEPKIEAETATEDKPEETSPDDLAGTPQPTVQKPKKKGWWSRGGDA